MSDKSSKYLIIMIISSVILVACADEGTTHEQAEYEAGTPLAATSLILPPGLTNPETDTTYKMLYRESAPNSYELNKIPDMTIMSGGSERWLVIKNKGVNQVFPLVENFLHNQNVAIKYKNINIGLIQTDWIDRNNVTKTGIMHEFLGWIGLMHDVKALPSMYNFRINIWQNGNDTNIFVTDYQINQTIEAANTKPIWVSSPANPQTELDFLIQFMGYIKLGPGVIAPVNVANHEGYKVATNNIAMAKLDNNVIIIYDDFDQAWWRAGIALDRVGLGVADRNRSLGELYVYPLKNDINNSDPGEFKRFFGDDTTNVSVPKPKYTIKLIADGNDKTKLTIAPYQNKPDPAFDKEAKNYLEQLLSQLK